MRRSIQFAFFCASMLLAYPAMAGSLDALFDQETERGGNTNQPSRSDSKQNTSSLDDLMEQEQQEEARQHKIAKEKRKAEEAHLRQLAEAQRKQEEAKRIAAQRERERAAQQARINAEQRERESNQMMGWIGAAISMKHGAQNTAATFLEQAITGNDNTDAINSALDQDITADRQRAEAAQHRQEEAIRQQQEMQRRQAEENNRRIETYNRQQAALYNQQRQQKEQQRQQQQTSNRVWPVPTKQWCLANPNTENPNCASLIAGAQQEEKQRRSQPVNECITTKKVGDTNYLYNRCGFRVEVWWRDEGRDKAYEGTWAIGPNTYTSAGGGVIGHVVFMACKAPAIALESGCDPL